MSEKEELEERLEILEKSEFYIKMKDRWLREDYDEIDKIYKEKRKIKERLERLVDNYD